MEKQPVVSFGPAEVTIAAISVIGLYIVSRYSYVAFHTLVELFSIVIGFGLFMLTWNLRRIIDNNYLVFIGIAYLFVSGIDLAHTLSYKGIDVFANRYGVGLNTQFWIAARYLESLALFVSPFYISRKLRANWVLTAFAALTFVLLASILLRVFPVCYIEGSGLTRFKIVSEYVISAVLLCSLLLLLRKRGEFDRTVLALVAASIIATIGAELAFTFYVGFGDSSNLVGHYLKVLSFYLIYKAVIETGLTRPYDILFRNLKLHEENLGRQREWLRVTLTSIGDAVIAADTFGMITFINPVAEVLTGWHRADAVGQPIMDIFRTVNEETNEPGENIVERVLREGSVVTLANCTALIGREGGTMPIEDSAAPIKDSTGNVTGVVLVFHDVTEKRKTAEALHQSEERYRSLFNGMTEGFALHEMICDSADKPIDYRFLEINPAFEQLTGLKRDHVMGKLVSEVLPNNEPYWVETYGAVVLTGNAIQFENYSSVLEKHYEVFAYRPAPRQFAVLFMDITERKRAQEKLKQVNEELEQRVQERTSELKSAYEALRKETEERGRIEERLGQAQKLEAIGTLAGGIAHDFNNVLAAIIGFSEMIRDKIPEREEQIRRHLERVLTAGIRGRDLVKQLLTFSRQGVIEKKPLQLSAVVEETSRLLRASLPATVHIKANMESESGFVLADPTQMQQIVLNLCTNAAHAMKRTGGTMSIDLVDFSFSSAEDAPDSTMVPGPYMRLAVTDTGVGMSQEVLERIFDPFFTTKPKDEGTGLGLAVVHGIVMSHQGGITVQSKPDKGTTFNVYLPKLVLERMEDSGDIDSTIQGGSERVLFIDDEEALAEMGSEVLTELGYRVVSKTGSREALAQLRLDPSRFDLVITDMTMPELTGTELAREILLMKPDMPIILCTGFSHLVDAGQAKQAGIRAFAMKPLTKKEIAKTIRQVLDE
jgi:PAS domain S-box-containing protein